MTTLNATQLQRGVSMNYYKLLRRDMGTIRYTKPIYSQNVFSKTDVETKQLQSYLKTTADPLESTEDSKKITFQDLSKKDKLLQAILDTTELTGSLNGDNGDDADNGSNGSKGGNKDNKDNGDDDDNNDDNSDDGDNNSDDDQEKPNDDNDDNNDDNSDDGDNDDNNKDNSDDDDQENPNIVSNDDENSNKKKIIVTLTGGDLNLDGGEFLI
jgi:hypothetical protein